MTARSRAKDDADLAAGRAEAERHVATGTSVAAYDLARQSDAYRRGYHTRKRELREAAGNSAPVCGERCVHGQRLPLCDHCANVPRMGRWAAALSGYELADALETLDREPRYYAPAEAKAVLIEAARRVRPLPG